MFEGERFGKRTDEKEGTGSGVEEVEEKRKCAIQVGIVVVGE